MMTTNLKMIHKPVLLEKVIEYLNPKPDENFIDGTIGEAGYARGILEKTLPDGKLLGIDWDQKQAEASQENLKEFGQRTIIVCDNYANLKKIVSQQNFNKIDGILLDLGMSSKQLEESGRGFTFLKDEPLDMRFSGQTQNSKVKSQNDLTAEKIVNEYSEKEIGKILIEYGEERFAQKIAKKIIEARKIKPIKTTFQLVEIIKRAVPGWYQRRKINAATKTFQALRIAVNEELENLKKFLPQATELLAKDGRLAIISFHSLEDRIVKNFFREASRKGEMKIIAKKPITASAEEIKQNPKSRSAKLRVAIKI